MAPKWLSVMFFGGYGGVTGIRIRTENAPNELQQAPALQWLHSFSLRRKWVKAWLRVIRHLKGFA